MMDAPDPKISIEDVRLLAQLHRDMDAGKIFYVMLEGERIAVDDQIADELGLEKGQTICRLIFQEIMKANLASIEAQIAIHGAAE